MKKIYNFLMITIFTYTFFGLCYPEYVLLPDTYVYIDMEHATTDSGFMDNKKRDTSQDFYNILGAKSGDVMIKSRLFETLSGKIDMEGKQTCQTEKKQEQQKMQQ